MPVLVNVTTDTHALVIHTRGNGKHRAYLTIPHPSGIDVALVFVFKRDESIENILTDFWTQACYNPGICVSGRLNKFFYNFAEFQVEQNGPVPEEFGFLLEDGWMTVKRETGLWLLYQIQVRDLPIVTARLKPRNAKRFIHEVRHCGLRLTGGEQWRSV